MEFKYHLIFELIILVILLQIFNLQTSSIIFLVHFIPSLDFLMKKANFVGKLHRQLFHNIFILILTIILLYIFTNSITTILGGLNLIFHFCLDLSGNGIAIFFPITKWRLKI